MATATWTDADIPDLQGKTVVVTGANSGLGYEATRMFAERGADVILACRSVDRGKDAVRSIRDTVEDPSLSVGALDLASLDSIRNFAETLMSEETPIDILCNNAGVMAIPRTKTEDGFEMQFGVNHLGHFALTGLLLERLIETPGESRVVTHSSGAHKQGKINFDDLQHGSSYSRWGAYAQSKLANLLFAYELDRKLNAAGAPVVSTACHPGYAATNLQRRGAEMDGSKLKLAMMNVANRVFGQSPAMGALPMVYAAVEPTLTGGEYVGPSGLLDMRGYPETQRSSDRSYSEETATQLWDVSESLTGVTYTL